MPATKTPTRRRALTLRSLLSAAVLCAAAWLPASAFAQSEAEMEELEVIEGFLGVMQSFFDVIDSMYSISNDPERSAIFYMHKIQEAYEEKDEKARSAEVFEKVIEDSANPTIRAAAYFMWGDQLKEDGKVDEAIKVLRKGLDESLGNAAGSSQ